MFEKKIAMQGRRDVTGVSVEGKYYEADKDGVVKVPREHAHVLLESGFNFKLTDEDIVDVEQAQDTINQALEQKQKEYDGLQATHAKAIEENTQLKQQLEQAQQEIVRLTQQAVVANTDKPNAGNANKGHK